ncbi:GDSL-type esterase/lipase family protein [Viscerimonas tarda]
MKKQIYIALCFLLVFVVAANAQDKPLKIACVGNSITAGVGASDRVKKGYVGIFSQLMGEKFDIQNFGVSGATASRNTYKAYDKTDKYTAAKEFQPDIVTIKLGTNDSQPRVWNTDNYAKNFRQDVIALCEEFEKLESKPQIYLCLPIPILPSRKWAHQPDVLQKEIIPILKEVAKKKKYKLIDLYTPLAGRNDCFLPGDTLHPNDLGHLVIAAELYKVFSTRNSPK